MYSHIDPGYHDPVQNSQTAALSQLFVVRRWGRTDLDESVRSFSVLPEVEMACVSAGRGHRVSAA